MGASASKVSTGASSAQGQDSYGDALKQAARTRMERARQEYGIAQASRPPQGRKEQPRVEDARRRMQGEAARQAAGPAIGAAIRLAGGARPPAR